jgi:hypothetical protein
MKIIYPDLYLRVLGLIAEEEGKTIAQVKAEVESK